MGLFLSVFCLWVAFFPLARGASDYTLADLEVLVGDGNYSEFFDHALDIRPSERQGPWKEMVIRMGDVFARKTLAKAQLERKDFLEAERFFTWKDLSSDDIFRSRRQEIGLRYLKSCLKGPSPCWEDLKAFWEKDKTDAETSYQLAQLTSTLEGTPLSTWSLLSVALKSPLSEFYCKKPFVMATLWGKIELDYARLGPEGDLANKISESIHLDCVPALLTEARKKLYRPGKSFDRELAFYILKSQGRDDEEVSDFFFTVYLLETPSQGELFNYSWNRVKKLGETPERREKVMTQVRRLDPLPDKIFSSLDQMKRKVVLRHMKGHFPEYLDYYVNQCLSYYGGKTTFPQGNPTIHCQDFMSSDLAPLLLEDIKLKQYQEVRKI